MRAFVPVEAFRRLFPLVLAGLEKVLDIRQPGTKKGFLGRPQDACTRATHHQTSRLQRPRHFEVIEALLAHCSRSPLSSWVGSRVKTLRKKSANPGCSISA